MLQQWCSQFLQQKFKLSQLHKSLIITLKAIPQIWIMWNTELLQVTCILRLVVAFQYSTPVCRDSEGCKSLFLLVQDATFSKGEPTFLVSIRVIHASFSLEIKNSRNTAVEARPKNFFPLTSSGSHKKPLPFCGTFLPCSLSTNSSHLGLTSCAVKGSNLSLLTHESIITETLIQHKGLV